MQCTNNKINDKQTVLCMAAVYHARVAVPSL